MGKFDRDPRLQKMKPNLTMHVNTSHKAAILVIPGQILRKCLQPFI